VGELEVSKETKEELLKLEPTKYIGRAKELALDLKNHMIDL
jgi:hypothetical protein